MRFDIRETTVAFVAIGILGTGLEAHAQTTRPAPPQTAAKPAAAPAKPVQAPKPAGVSNQDVIALVKAGMTDDFILTFLSTQTQRAFDLSAAGIVALKSGGVSETVMTAMLGKTPPAAAPVVNEARFSPAPVGPTARPIPISTSKDDVGKMRDAGIYALLGGKLAQLEPGTASSAGVSGASMAGSAFSMGIKKVKVKASVTGPRSNARVGDSTEFYFYGSGGSFNPNQFVLVRLEAGGDGREIVIGEAGMTGVKQGIRAEDQVRVQITKIESGIYKVVVDRPLAPGEYAFLNLSQLTSPTLFDFGVDR